jgi:hypothetical protein
MPQWEYSKIDLNDGSRKVGDTDVLNVAGEQGWEPVAITANHFAHMKRQPAEPTPPKRTRHEAAS